MAETKAEDELYIRLREFMDALPGGFPSTESGVEMKILHKLFSPEDAEMVLCMTRHPEPAAAIAERREMPEAGATELLDSMASRGLIVRTTEEGQPRYEAEQFAVGFYELQMKMSPTWAFRGQGIRPTNCASCRWPRWWTWRMMSLPTIA